MQSPSATSPLVLGWSPLAGTAPSHPGAAVERLGRAGIGSRGCSCRECPGARGAVPGCRTGGSRGSPGLSSLLAALGEYPGASPAPLWGSPSGIWGMIPAPTEGSAVSAAPAPSPRLTGIWGQVLSLPPGLLAASPPCPLILSLGKGAAAKGRPREALPGGAPCAGGDFGELPGAATRPLLVPSGGSCPPAASLPAATHSSGSASGDGGSDTHSVSTIWGSENARLAGAASGSWVENSDRLWGRGFAWGGTSGCREILGFPHAGAAGHGRVPGGVWGGRGARLPLADPINPTGIHGVDREWKGMLSSLLQS